MKLTVQRSFAAAIRLAVSFAWLSMSVTASAQGMATTTVQGTVYLANGRTGSGTLQLSWPAFTTAGNQAVTAGRTNVTIGADGYVSVKLAPNQGSMPAGLYYTAVYHLSDGTTSSEYWVVPSAAQANLAQVRAQVMPAAQAVQAVSKGYVDQSITELTQSLLTASGGTLSGPLYLNGDPTQTKQAATKHYVDAGFANAVPMSGAALTGPLTSVQLGAAYQVDQFPGADFGARLQTCLDKLDAVYGGTCDARNFSGTLGMGSALVIATANATVQLPCATIATANQIQVTPGTRNVTLRGCALRGASNESGSQGGTVFLYSGSSPLMQVGDPTYATNTPGFHLDNVVINTTASANASAQGLAAYRTQELNLQGLYFLGNSNQTGMTLDGTGNYTGGTFQDLEFGGFGTAVNAIGHQAANSATTDWLNASTFLRLHINCPTSDGSPLAGTYGINLQQGDGNTFTGGDVEGCGTAMHLGPNAQNNTIVGLRNENSISQVVADPGSSYNNWITGGTMFTGQLTDNGTRNSFLDTFHRSFNGLNGDWYGSQKDATVTNHYRIGTGAGNERGLLNRYQTDFGYRWTTGLSDAAAGEQFYQVLDELNNVYRVSIGQYNDGQSSSNNQTVINAAGSGAVVLNGSSNAGTGGVIFGAGGSSGATVATINSAGNAQFNGSLQVAGPSTFLNSATVKNQADAEIDSVLWAGATANQKESFIYKDYTGASQWYMVKDASNNWALNSAIGGLDSIKAYQSNNSGDTYINASKSTGHIRLNYEGGSGAETDIYGGSSSALVAAFLGSTAIKFPGLAASSAPSCLQIDNSGYISNTGTACGTGSSGVDGTVSAGMTGQLAYYAGDGRVLAGMNAVAVSKGGTGASSAEEARENLGAQPVMAGLASDGASGIAVSGNVAADTAVAAVQDRGGQVFNIKAYGARSCPFDSTAAIQAAIDASKGAEVFLPAGKWCISAPLRYYTVPPTNGGYAAALNFMGAGHNRTQLLMLPSFTVPTSFNFNGTTAYVAPSMLDIQGVIAPLYDNAFQQHGEIKGISFTVYGCESNAAGGEPACAYVNPPAWATFLNSPYHGISAISIGGAWDYRIEDNDIRYMSGDGITAPFRLDVDGNGDHNGTWGLKIEGNQITFNKGWGIWLSGGNAQSTVGGHIGNIITYNSLGGLREMGADDNTIAFNSFGVNGCGQPRSNANSVDEIAGTSLASPATCSSNPLGPGIWIGRDGGPAAGGPYNNQAYKNQCDSNAASCITISEAQNENLWSNMAFRHHTVYPYNSTFGGGYASEVPSASYILGVVSGSGTSLVNEYQRSDMFSYSGKPTPGALGGNALLDSGTTTLDLGFGTAGVYGNQNNFANSALNTGNYVPYAIGGGAAFGLPVTSSLGGGQIAVSSWPLTGQGVGYSSAAPTLTVLGGDSAWTKETLLTLTQSGGILNGCTVTQAGGPYSRMPLLNVQDTGSTPTGTGGAITLTLSGGTSGTPTACAISAGGSGYTRPLAGVAPTCTTTPIVAARATIGVVNIQVNNYGKYGAWTPGSTPPVVTVTVNDPTGSGVAATPLMRPINIGTGTTQTLVWGVAGVIIKDADHGHDMQSLTSATATFSTCGGCTPATGTVQVNWVLAPTLTISNAGSCDAGAFLWVNETGQTAIGSTNTSSNKIFDQNVLVTQPSGANTTITDTLTLDVTHKDVNFVRAAGNDLGLYCGVLSGGLPTAACISRIYKSSNGTDSQYVENSLAGSVYTNFTHGSGSLAAQTYEFGTGDGTNGIIAAIGNVPKWQWDSTGAYFPSTGNVATLGTTGYPVASLLLGTAGVGSINIQPAAGLASNLTLNLPVAFATETAAVFPSSYGSGNCATLTATAGVLGDAGAPCGTNPTSIIPSGGQPLSDFICAKGNDKTIGSAAITAFTISGTTATITATTPQTNQYFVGETIKTTGTTPSSMDGRVTITSVSSTQIVGTTLDAQSGSYTSGGSAYHVCTNSTDAVSATSQAFPSTLVIPTPGAYPISYNVSLMTQQWTTATAPNLGVPFLNWNGTLVGSWQSAGTLRASSVGVMGSEAFSLYLPYSGVVLASSDRNSYGSLSASSTSTTAVTTSSGGTLTFKTSFVASGIASGTYTSGGSITGTVGQTCTLATFNGANSGGTATVALTGTNVIAGGTALTITNTGFASTSAATSATLGSGTATCSGTATVATVLGGAQGNAIRLLVLKATPQP